MDLPGYTLPIGTTRGISPLGMFWILGMNRRRDRVRRGVVERSEAGVEAVAEERAGSRHGNVITNNIPESL
ncbi:hypothetical protein [[Clostridium] hylemonae]|uniref:hypothetical protein n=1 Tax=[Clostridium] hylemonae TaxID=89153 RepID=UPI001FCADF9F|nr:hypothetical protein [[Clostridium] hylemonae]BDF04301.1 hypothetical protein CE91St63_13630 [[Clostridium] hylemonae]